MKAADWRKRIPTAISDTSDLANAGRIVAPFEEPLVATPQGFFELSDDRWIPADTVVYHEAACLGRTIRTEVGDFPGKSDKARLRWARRSEMKSRIDAAVEILRRLLAVDNLDQVQVD